MVPRASIGATPSGYLPQAMCDYRLVTKMQQDDWLTIHKCYIFASIRGIHVVTCVYIVGIYYIISGSLPKNH